MPKYDFDSAPIIQPKKQSYDFDSAPIVKSESNVPEWKSALRGAAQGVTSGFADELTAGAEALLTPKSYDQALAESRANYKQGLLEGQTRGALLWHSTPTIILCDSTRLDGKA